MILSKPKVKNRAAVALLSLFALGSTSAHAADAVLEPDPAPPEPTPITEIQESGWYIAGRIGAAFADDTEFSTLGTQVENAYDVGYAFSGAVGYEFKTDSPLSFRAEGEVGYSKDEIDTHNVVGTGVFNGGDAFGETTTFYGLVNGYIDYELGPITPFVSAGVGYGQLDFSGHGVTPTGVVLNDQGSGVAWQVGAGAAYSVTDTVKLDLGYRYFGIENAGVTATDATGSDVDYRAHQITLGIRKAF